jgi:putative membrane protein
VNTSNSRVESFKAAFFQSPGPRDAGEVMLLFGKGVCMGSADIVPGVSGGTIALITGIYGQLLEAIGSINAAAVKDLLRGDLSAFVRRIHLRFLLVLLSGIGIALISLARLMYFLLEQHPVPTWGFFLGLIAASLLVLGRDIRGWAGSGGLFFLLGAVGAYFLVALIPVSTPETTWFIFFSGAIAICAMILPGISGSFLLLILGKYHFVTGALRNPLVPENMLILAVFGAGCVVGILSFSKLLNFLMHRYHNLTMSLLTGLICGSMRKIWPWKEVLEKVVIGDKTYVLRDRNILPPSLDGEFWLTCMLALLGFALVLLLQHVSKRHHPSG